MGYGSGLIVVYIHFVEPGDVAGDRLCVAVRWLVAFASRLLRLLRLLLFQGRSKSELVAAYCTLCNAPFTLYMQIPGDLTRYMCSKCKTLLAAKKGT
jgi:hypothetical protein